jgi:hypothetical protein
MGAFFVPTGTMNEKPTNVLRSVIVLSKLQLPFDLFGEVHDHCKCQEQADASQYQ